MAVPFRCATCFLQTPVCLCAQIVRVATRTRFLIVRHAAEAFKNSNSGRIAALALENSEILAHGDVSRGLDESKLRQDGTWLLFPEGEINGEQWLGKPPKNLVVLDGTWPQARRMRQRIRGLRGLPTLSLPKNRVATQRLRTERLKNGMTTLEAVARAVELFEGTQQAARLDRLHDTLVERSRKTGRHF